jgi:hypothetical protein
MSDNSEQVDRIKAVKQAYQNELMAKANVQGVAVGFRLRNGVPTDEVALVVMVSHKVARDQLAPEDFVPAEIEGVPVDVQSVGEIRAQS